MDGGLQMRDIVSLKDTNPPNRREVIYPYISSYLDLILVIDGGGFFNNLSTIYVCTCVVGVFARAEPQVKLHTRCPFIRDEDDHGPRWNN